MNMKKLWHALQAGLIGFWLAVPIVQLTGFEAPLLVPLAGLILLAHVLEIPLAARKLAHLNLPFGHLAFKTLVFGFTWWLPLSKGHIQA